MTRKQALHKALSVLSELNQSDELKEVETKLTEIINELPLTAWTKETIFDAFDQFAIDNGRNATITDLKHKGLPSHPTVKHRFGMDAKEFIDTYYPSLSKCDSKMFGNKTREEWLKLFIDDYNAKKPSTAEYYNLYRNKGLPAWASVARLFDITKWNDFKRFCAVPTYTKSKHIKKQTIELKLNRHTDLDKEFAKHDKK